MRFLTLMMAALVLYASLAAAEPALTRLEPGPEASVLAVTGPAEMTLDGREQPLRLAGLWPGIPAATGKETANTATAYLRSLVQGKRVRLYFDRRRHDRHGRTIAHAALLPADGGAAVWLQGALLKAGMARVYVVGGDAELAPEMLALEEEARRTGRGLWRDPAYLVRDAAEPTAVPQGFQLVEGTVLGVGVGSEWIYLNFGDHWPSDFTVMVPRRLSGRFPGRMQGLRRFEGNRLRVRGWVFQLNGPAIQANSPHSIEVLKD